MCRGIASVVGSRITGVERPRSRLQSIAIVPRFDAFKRRIENRTIVGLGRIGKRVVLELDSGDRLVLEPRMSGLILLRRPPNKTHLRLIFHLAGGNADRFLFWDQRGLGVASLLAGGRILEAAGTRENRSRRPLHRAGDTPRTPGHDPPADQGGADGSKAAGGNRQFIRLGNSASLPHPPGAAMPPAPRKEWERIHAAMREVLEEAIRHQGSTLRDGTYRIARNEPGNFQIRHRVYQRHGEACLQCGKANIVRIVQAQRSTFFCPACQRK